MCDTVYDDVDVSKNGQEVRGLAWIRYGVISTFTKICFHLIEQASHSFHLSKSSTHMAIIGEARPPQDVFHAMEEDEELFEEQIEQLLKQAETRLRQQQHLSKHDSRYLPTIPAAGKLDASTLPKPYVQHDGEVARVDTDKILDERQRKLADGAIRTVEDPLIVRKKTLEVCVRVSFL